MEYIADLHIHGKYSRGTSINLDFKNLEKYAKIKGIDVLGTGDFSQPKWFDMIKKEMKEENGIMKTKTGYPFVLQTEYSFIYSQDGKGRRVHLIVLAPGIETAEQINDFLQNKKKFNIEYDGRPILGKYPCYEFAEDMMNISKNIEIIPAHIWTPWFSILGKESGFDRIDECFKEQTKNIHALETGLSSDPEMNWRLSQLDKFTLVSNSDSHSYWPWRIGREANVFELQKLSYENIINAIRTKKGFKYTIEVDPAYGKYHEDGHRKCGIRMTPEEAIKHKNICPVCLKPLTIGVLHRVEELADREHGFRPENAVDFKKIIPLSEVISEVSGKGISTKLVNDEYEKLLKTGKNEFDILLKKEFDELKNATNQKLADAIMKNREGEITVEAGYDGVYGKPRFNGKRKAEQETKPEKKKQARITDFSM